MGKTIREIFGEDVECLFGVNSPNEIGIYTERKVGDLKVIKTEFEIKANIALKELCKDSGIDFIDDSSSQKDGEY